MGLSTAQLGAVTKLVQSVPDALLGRLNAALSAARAADPMFGPVTDIALAEADDRLARDIVLEPLKRLAGPGLQPPQEAQLKPIDLARIWRLMKSLSPEGAAAAASAALMLRVDDVPPSVFNHLCIQAATALKDPQLRGIAAAWSPMERARMARLLAMTPVLRASLPRLSGWVRNLSGDHMAMVRLAFKDVTDEDGDCGLLFMEALLVHLEEPYQILRLISAVMDRPTDRYLASSELACLGERLLTDIDRRVQGVRKFDPGRGFEGGAAEASSLAFASNAVKEFEQWLTMNKDGPWGIRIAVQKQALAQGAEARLRETEPAVAAALPLQAGSMIGGRAPRAGPKVEGYPNDGLVRRAEGLLAFLDETRSSAEKAGFAALRAKVLESLEQRLDAYVQDLVERLHDGDGEDADWVRAYLEVAADFSGMIRGPQAAQIIRRRAAAA